MANGPTFDDNYQSVAERIRIFREKHAEGSLRPLDPSKPYEIVGIGEKVYIIVTSAAYRSPDDEAPGVGIAWQVFPGTDEYTRDNEVMIAQTSSWGRAIVATLAADATKIASADEVTAAKANRGAPAPARPASNSAATANGTSVKPDAAPDITNPEEEEYNAAVITESVRLMNEPSTTFEALRDVWQVLTQGRLSARRINPPADMEPDGDGLVAIGAAVAFVGKKRKDAAEARQAASQEAAPEAPPAEETPAPRARRGRKAVEGE